VYALDETGGQAEGSAELGFASGHLAGVGLMVFAGEVEEAVEQEDFYLGGKSIIKKCGLAGGGVEGDGEVACVLLGDLGRSGEAEDVSGLVFPAVGAVEALKLGVRGEKDVDLTREADGDAGTVEEAREAGLRLRGDGRGTWRFDGDHRCGGLTSTEGRFALC
jgi:hypothetical protein